MITQTYNIDLIPSGVPTIVHVSQYDSASRTIAMSIYDGGVAYDLTDKIVTVRGTKQDNTGFEYPCTVDGNVASFVLNAQMTIFSGDVPCEIRIAENGFVIGSHNFVLRVERTPLDSSIVISDTELPLIEEAEQNAVRAEQAADEAEALLSTVVKSVNSVTPDAQGNVDVVALPTGGTAGQYLRKESSADGDADWENIDASNIVYDNTSSGLTATDVQAAIDETSLLGGRYFYNRTVTTWASDSTYSDYPYKGTINITGVTDADGVEVTFSNADATSGNYSPICATFNGGVYIWSKTQDANIVIPTICIYGRSNEDLSGEFPYLSLEGGTVRGDVTVTGNLYANGTDANSINARISALETAVSPSAVRMYEDAGNRSVFTITDLPNLGSNVRFKYGILYGGTNSVGLFMYLLFIGVNGTDASLTRIIDNSSRTFTVSLSNGVLTISTNNTLYGGIRLIWINGG